MKLSKEDALVLAKALFSLVELPIVMKGFVATNDYHHLQLLKQQLDTFILEGSVKESEED